MLYGFGGGWCAVWWVPRFGMGGSLESTAYLGEVRGRMYELNNMSVFRLGIEVLELRILLYMRKCTLVSRGLDSDERNEEEKYSREYEVYVVFKMRLNVL
ncbi:hypothetical protein Tco_0777915 [Tanacetum coccineum]